MGAGSWVLESLARPNSVQDGTAQHLWEVKQNPHSASWPRWESWLSTVRNPLSVQPQTPRRFFGCLQQHGESCISRAFFKKGEHLPT